VNERTSNLLLAGAAMLVFLLLYVGYRRPGYFASSTYLGGLIFLEGLLGAIWFYRSVFFPLVTVAFLFAGMNLPLGGVWTSARWLVLGAGALVGCFIMLKEHRARFHWFHLLALTTGLAALVSAVVSRYPGFALLKAFSLVLLFFYAACGVRLAVIGRENRFFNGLLIGCEIFVGGIAVLYALGIQAMGNPNSLGAVMGVVGVPLLLWGSLLEENVFLHKRRQFLCLVAMYLTLHSHSRSGLLAAFISCGLLCLALRRYRLFALGTMAVLVLVSSSAIFDHDAFSRVVSSTTEQVLYKGKDPNVGVFGSRQTPWQDAVESFHKHFWFGSGFGTTDNGLDATQSLQSGRLATTADAASENGSSYLTIVTWVGVLGTIPFFLLLLAVLGNVGRTVSWMWRTGDPLHPAVPLATVILAGLVHVAFEDWLFAVGYYLCVFFWSLAFILADFAPSASELAHAVQWTPRKYVRQGWTDVPAIR
jgi:O-antigen ligase